MVQKMKALVTKQDGQGMTEYGLVLGIIAVAVVALLVTLKDEIINIYQTALGNIQSRNG